MERAKHWAVHYSLLEFQREAKGMSKYIGMFVDDDEKNYKTVKRLLSLYDIELLPYTALPADIECIYQNILNEDVDFVIIDYDLTKQPVGYNGLDVLNSIREQDAEIYIIYLTNKEFVQQDIGKFDQTINKKEFANEIDNIVNRLRRALSRDLSIKNERELSDRISLQKEYFDKELEMLKMILEDKA